MKTTKRKWLISLLVAAVVIIAGCHKVVGGGWIEGLFGGKAHFAFQAQCEDYMGEDGWYYADFFTGQLQFMDQSAGVRFHGDITVAGTIFSPDPVTCEELGAALVQDFGEGGLFFGDCRSQPGNVPGTFSVTVENHEGGKGWMRADFISVETDCTPDGELYYNEGVIQGGNISLPGFKKEPKMAGKK